MTALDSMIGYISPKSALKRAIAREQLQFVRNYDAAMYGKKTKGWYAPKTSAQVETRISLPALRDRSRELLRNAPILRGMWFRRGWI